MKEKIIYKGMYKRKFTESSTRTVIFHIWSGNHRKHFTEVVKLLKKMDMVVDSSYTPIKKAKLDYGGDHATGTIEIKDLYTPLPDNEIERLAIKFDIYSDYYDDEYRGKR